jgi:phosphoribosyl-ATP pyrophosphohydrolase/phosphoribosyl-AMP cyclohydrolase
MNSLADNLRFDEKGLIPAVVQRSRDRRVLMVAYMNRESLEKTIETGQVHFWSRSRQEIWRKGATSGNVMKVMEVLADCDRDCLLIRVQPAGPACHTGRDSCFYDSLHQTGDSSDVDLAEMLNELAEVIHDRNERRPPESYTTKLLEVGVDQITKKIGEEAVEVVIAGKNEDRDELARESADLIYHLLVLWEASGLSASDVAAELKSRRR